MRSALVVVTLLALPALAADDDRLANAKIIYAREASLYQSDARGKNEALLAKLPTKSAIRAMRTDAGGTTLLVDLGGKWSWMPLDDTAKTLTELPCADGPAQLASDGACVICRSTTAADKSVIVQLRTNKVTPIDTPPAGARLVGEGAARRLVWADATGVYAAPPNNLRSKTKVAPDAPLRGFLPSPDGTRAAGVYTDIIHATTKTTKPADLLMTFALDGQGARRKTVKAAVPVEWSFDGGWLLVQDGSTACITKAAGGEYKCWRGFTGVSIAPDGSYALLLGNRDAAPAKSASSKKKSSAKKKAAAAPDPSDPTNEPEQAGGDDDSSDATDDVAVAPPSGPLALYRAKLDGAFTDRPVLVVKVVEGAAVWVPASK